MKKLLLLFVTLLSVNFIANAQIEKGTKMLGGNFNFSTGNYNNSSAASSNFSTIGFSPSFSWATKQNNMTGIRLSFDYFNQPAQQNGPNGGYYTRARQLAGGAGLFKRRYLTLGKGFYAFGNGAVDFSYGRATYTSISSDKMISTSFNAGVTIAPGISYQASKRLMVDLTLSPLIGVNYNHSKTDNKPVSGTPFTSTGGSLNLYSGLSTGLLGNVGIGFKILFGK